MRLWRGSDPLPASPKFQKRGIWERGMSLCLQTDLHAQNAVVPRPFSVFENGGGLEGVCGNKTLLAFTRTPHEKFPFWKPKCHWQLCGGFLRAAQKTHHRIGWKSAFGSGKVRYIKNCVFRIERLPCVALLESSSDERHQRRSECYLPCVGG